MVIIFRSNFCKEKNSILFEEDLRPTKMLQQLWNKFAEIGLTKEVKEREFVKIRVLNQLTSMTFINASALFLVTIIVSGDFFLALPHLVSIAFACSTFIFHHFHRFHIARHSACFIFPLWVALAIIDLQNNSNGEPAVFLICSLLAFIQYEGQLTYKITCLAWNVGLAIGSLIYITSYAPIHLNTYGFIVLTIGLIINISFIITFYQKDIRRIAKQKNKLVKQLQLKNSELERFAYITSHDLKEPVKNIEGFSRLLQKSMDQSGNKEYAQIANMIYDSSTRMSTLIDSILKFSRLERADMQFESVNLNDVVQGFKQSHSQLLQEKKAIIQYNNLPNVKGNKVYLSLLFQNLLENAIKYNESEVPSVKIFVHENKNDIHLVIDDNGIGIKENYEEYIFEPFRRLHNRKKYDGTGLGLAICKKIVDNHAGKIWVESDGNGSQFNIILPAQKTKAFHLN